MLDSILALCYNRVILLDKTRRVCKVCKSEIIFGNKYCRICRTRVRSAKAVRKQRVAWVKAKYGLEEKQYFDLLNAQEGCCGLCHERSEKTLNVDHDHTTGKVRALLCSRCNLLIGTLEAKKELTTKALEYLIKHQETSPK